MASSSDDESYPAGLVSGFVATPTKSRSSSSAKPSASYHGDRPETYEPTRAELEAMREARLREQESNPHYLKLGARPSKSADGMTELASEAITLEGAPELQVTGSDRYLLQHRQQMEALEKEKRWVW